MLKPVLFSILICAAAPATAAEVTISMTGIGRMSCAHWQSSQQLHAEGTAWIHGFWTGLNYVAVASEQSQADLDATTIVSEVDKTCAQKPSQVLASAVWSTFVALVKK
ncbi:MAG: hypothetical protein K2X60_08880 [Xanthobacteraceae bacterium]|nr:hypothetical protein [Xanthobacteraceae bacterium]